QLVGVAKPSVVNKEKAIVQSTYYNGRRFPKRFEDQDQVVVQQVVTEEEVVQEKENVVQEKEDFVQE
nr:hypothetical protein [Tanacetum cinerariifolium]